MNIGLDFDGTYTAAPEQFNQMIQIFREAGHKVYVVTMRYASEGKEVTDTLIGKVDGFIFTGRQAKHEYTINMGIEMHIWIEDTPQAVHMSAKQIWGWASVEGHIITPKHDEVKET